MNLGIVTSPLAVLIVGGAAIVAVSQVLDRPAGDGTGRDAVGSESSRPAQETLSNRVIAEPPRPTPVEVASESVDRPGLADPQTPPVVAESATVRAQPPGQDETTQQAQQALAAQREAEEARKAEQRRLVAQREADEARKAEGRRLAAQREAEEARKAEAQRLAVQREAEEARKAEQQRLAAQRDAEEAARKAQEAAQRRPNLRVYAQADADDRAGLGRYTAASYAALLRERLLTVARRQLGAPAVTDGDEATFRALLRDGRSGVARLCEQAGSVRLLLADVVAANPGFSNIDSAFWPGVVFTAINCDDGRLHKSQKKRLEPQRADAFEYEQHFVREAERFVASQGYFLEP